MFAIKTISHNVTLEPKYLDGNVFRAIQKLCIEELEGLCSMKHGFIVSVLVSRIVDNPRVCDDDGLVEFSVSCDILVLIPEKGQVIEAFVSNVNKIGVFAEVGPLTIFISKHHLPENLIFDESSHPPSFQTDDQSIRITQGAFVRLRIIGVKVESTSVFAIGTLKDQYLGLIY